MAKRKFVRLFEARKGHLDYRIRRDYVQNGIATIPCRIADYSDVINPYSVRDYETLNTEFLDYLKTTAEVTPPDCPLVLNIIGDCLSQEEKETIVEIIRDDFAYDLGMVEKEDQRQKRIFFFMLIGLIVSGTLLWLSETLVKHTFELLFIPFWFMGDMLCDYIFLTGYDIRWKRRLAGRLASIKVVFSESYEAPHYTKSDVEKLYSEIEKDVEDTIKKEGDEYEEAVYD